MTTRDNFLRTIHFERPELIPMRFSLSGAVRYHYDQDAMDDLMEAHPMLFADFKRRIERRRGRQDPRSIEDEGHTDPWGCVWKVAIPGLVGAVRVHPLADWSAFSGFVPPDPTVTDGVHPHHWGSTADRVAQQRADGELVSAHLPHGHTFLRLQDLRGYENTLYDMADGDPRLDQLIEMIERFNAGLIERWLALEPDLFYYPEDLGMQVGPMLSPAAFRQYIKPVYQRLMAPTQDAGVPIHMHSDGDVRLLADDILDCGVDCFNVQDLVCGIDWIEANLKGRVCIDLDIDRQAVTVHGTPKEIDAHIRNAVERLGSKDGGLMMVYGLYPGTPLENTAAIMDAMEKYAGYYA